MRVALETKKVVEIEAAREEVFGRLMDPLHRAFLLLHPHLGPHHRQPRQGGRRYESRRVSRRRRIGRWRRVGRWHDDDGLAVPHAARRGNGGGSRVGAGSGRSGEGP